MKYLIGIILGFLLHKGVYEISNFRITYNYKKCVKITVNKKDYYNKDTPSAYQTCKQLLEYNTLENILLYQPNYWDNISK